MARAQVDIDQVVGLTSALASAGTGGGGAGVGIFGETRMYSGSGNWIVPAGVTNIKVMLQAGGGTGYHADGNIGSGINSSFVHRGYGGGGGGFAEFFMSVTPGQSISYSVGAASNNTTFSNVVANAGGAASISSVGTGSSGNLNGRPGAIVTGANGSYGEIEGMGVPYLVAAGGVAGAYYEGANLSGLGSGAYVEYGPGQASEIVYTAQPGFIYIYYMGAAQGPTGATGATGPAGNAGGITKHVNWSGMDLVFVDGILVADNTPIV